VRIEWAASAFSDRDAIFDYIKADNPASAARVDEVIRAQAQPLMEFPEMGRKGRVGGTRELIVAGLPYILVYHIVDDSVRVLRVLHSAQQLPDTAAQ
jgi:toxin ParE1/3/4